MRVFLAARPPDAVIEELVSLQWGLTGARWTDPDQFHLTLRFVPHLGDVTPWVERLRGINWEPLRCSCGWALPTSTPAAGRLGRCAAK